MDAGLATVLAAAVTGAFALLAVLVNRSHKENKKDHNSKNGLLKMVGRRKRYLSYMAKNDIERYRALIAKLGLRK